MRKDKILFYIDKMYKGGAQRVMNVLIEHYLNENFEIILVTDCEDADKTKEYFINKKVKRYYLRENNNGNKIIKNIEKCYNLRRIIKKENPFMVISFLGNPNKRLLLSTIGIKCQKVVSVRNDPKKEYGGNFISRILVNTIFLLCDKCIFQTFDASKYFWKVIRNKSEIIFNPVKEDFYIKNDNEIKKNLITVGRLEPQKNHLLLINSFAKISSEFPNEKLLIFGTGKLKEKLENRINELGLNEKVILKGETSNVKNELEKSKIFILSSDYEGMPNALMEAMATGTACISTDCPCGGPKSLITSEDQGILVKCDAEDELVSAIRKMLINDNYKKYHSSTRKRALEFKTNVIFKKWDAFLFD